MKRRTGRCGIPAALIAIVFATVAQGNEPVVGGPCEGCENVFVELPAGLSSSARIAPEGTPGESLVIVGTVTDLGGKPAAGIIVYAYHTDAEGIYPDAATRHGALRAWALTDAEGNYRFDTIRPASYPNTTIAQHVHMHVIEPGRCTYWIDSIHFDDDPLLTPSDRERVSDRGGSGIVNPTRDPDGVWHVRRDIVLGKNVPGYPCRRRWTFPVPFFQSLSWSPDGTRIAFSAVMTDWRDEGYRIYVARADGSGPVRLDTGGTADLYPAWSPDGLRIAFASKRGGESDIYVMAADGTGVTQLTSSDAADSYPSWSPDGARIALHTNRDGNYEIYAMDADGSNPTRLTDNPADDYSPTWSPDGQHIAFESDRNDIEGGELYLMGPDGGSPLRLTEAGVFPTWSPDGMHLLFTAGGLRLVNLDGSGERVLLDHSVYGAWSPDGAWIAATFIEFDSECADLHSVVRIRPDGSGREKILP
jgi:protocatechuate 3,4-dioxygenase beta subunit